MPTRLTSRDYRLIGICVLVAAVSLAIGVKYFSHAFPEAAIQFRYDRDSSTPLAEKFLAGRGIPAEGYRHAAIFDFDDNAKVYLERTQGLERMNSLTRGPIHLWRWSHRWFKPQQKEEFRVDVTPAGEIAGFDHEIPEAASGANLDSAAARVIAEQFLTGTMKRDLSDLEFIETESEKRPARTDHSFIWKQKSVNLGDGSLRVEVDVDGDQVGGYSEFIKIPEQWQRDYSRLRSRNEAAQVVDQVFWILLTVAGAIILILRLRDRDVPTRLSVALGLIAAALYFLGQLNSFSLEQFGYKTTDSYSSFVSSYLGLSLVAALGIGAWIFFLVASSEPVYRQGCPGLISFRRYLSWQGLRTRSFFLANVVGISLTFFFFAYQTVFYLAANRFGAWAPADVKYSDLLRTRFPWVFVLFMGFLPAVTEEMQFRAFAIPFLRRHLRSGVAALVLAAFIWGFLHSAYPNQPFFIRGVEVGVGGLIIGLIMLRFGILATLIWHYSVDAIYGAFLLLRSGNSYLMVSGGAAAGIMLVPLIVALIAYLRTGAFAEEAALTNAAHGVSRPARPAAAETEAAVTYQPLSTRRWTFAWVLAIVLLAAVFIRVHRIGEGITFRTSRAEAIRAAQAYLRQRHLDPDRYHHVAWLIENVNPLAIRYFLERKPVETTNQIYQQATRLVLWEVRYFRPLEIEEYLVYVDPATGRVFNYRHVLDENAPGAALSPEQAKTLALQALEQNGYNLQDFVLQDAEAEKKKAREDYTLTWQAKAADPRNVGDSHFRLAVDIAGDQVVGFNRFFKLPEGWEREQQASHLINALLAGLSYLVYVLLVTAMLILLVKQIRAGRIPWRRSLWIGVGVAFFMLLTELNSLPMVERGYPTSIPLGTYRVFVAVSTLVFPLLAGLLCWLLAGLAASFYPDVWAFFRAPARRLWRRDALAVTALAVTGTVCLSRLDGVFGDYFHAYVPIRLDLLPGSFNAYSPGLEFLLGALIWSVVAVLVVALIIYIARIGWESRAWWLWLAVALVLVSLGPPRAHTLREYLLGWVMGVVPLAGAVVLVSLFFRSNVLAYVATAFATQAVGHLTEIFSQSAGFLRWNGVLFAVLAAAALGWMFITPTEAQPPRQEPIT